MLVDENGESQCVLVTEQLSGTQCPHTVTVRRISRALKQKTMSVMAFVCIMGKGWRTEWIISRDDLC